MLNIYGLLLIFALVFPCAAKAHDSEPHDPHEQEESVVVVELFSSQACMFCPKADDFLIELDKRSDIIALSCHVDYFDMSDNFLSKPFCTQRQNEYVRLLASGTNYTPQMIINGRHDRVGYNFDEVNEAIEVEKTNGEVWLLVIEQDEQSGDFSFQLPDASIDQQKHSLTLFVYRDPQSVQVTQGVNKGKKQVYINVARSIDKMTQWDGKEARVIFAVDTRPSDEGLVVLVQSNETGEIVAAGRHKLPDIIEKKKNPLPKE